MSAGPSNAAALLASPVRRRIVDALVAVDPVDDPAAARTAAELAAEVGLHVTTVRFHLDQLVAAGLVDVRGPAARAGAGRPRKFYVARAGLPRRRRPASEVGSLRLLSGLLAQTLAERRGRRRG